MRKVPKPMPSEDAPELIHDRMPLPVIGKGVLLQFAYIDDGGDNG